HHHLHRPLRRADPRPRPSRHSGHPGRVHQPPRHLPGAVMSRIRKQLERGEVSELAIVVVVALFIMIGLVVDGGAKMNAAVEASPTAQEAARVGAQPLESLPSDTQAAQLSAAGAAAAAQDYLTQAGATGSVQVVDPTTIEVTVTS